MADGGTPAAAALIAGGRTGRAMLAGLVGLEPHLFSFALADGTADKSALTEQVRNAAEQWLLNAGSVTDSAIFRHASGFVNSIAHGGEGSWRGLDDVLLAAKGPLQAVAAEAMSRSAFAWWADGTSLHSQSAYLRHVHAGVHTTAVNLEEAVTHISDKAKWWVYPDNALVSSRGPVFGHPSVVSVATDDHWMQDKGHSLWAVEVTPGSRIFEVHSKRDWSRLVYTYPLSGEGFMTYNWGNRSRIGSRLLLPDWPAISKDWDGVHVSFVGYLSAAYEPIPLDEDRHVLLAGWHPDATTWLTASARTTKRLT